MCRRALARAQISINPTTGLELRAVLYAGLRRGELRALRWSDVDLANGVIHERRGWDGVEGELKPKSRAGVRKVGSTALAFGIEPERPFEPWSVADRATKAWERAALTRITLHECRHTFASLMIAAGVNAKALQVFMGHASVSITLDRYGHLFPGSEQEAGVLLDQHLERMQVKPALPTDPDRGKPRGSLDPPGAVSNGSKRHSRTMTNHPSNPLKSPGGPRFLAERSGAGIEPTHRRVATAHRF